VRGSYKFNVIITTWEHVMQDEKDGGLLASMPWDCAIIDEAHRYIHTYIHTCIHACIHTHAVG
jgi:hypothetical protein